jgi:hypothetical protein
MKKLDTLLSSADVTLQQTSSTSIIPTGKTVVAANPPIDQKIKTLVNMLFARFMTIYGHKFKSAFDDDKEIIIAKREWALSLAGYEEDVLVLAIEQAKRQYSWMPSIAEFLQLMDQCQQSFGLAPAEQAYAEACRHATAPSHHPWSHAAVYHAGRATGWFELKSLPRQATQGRFNLHYKVLCQRVLAGENLEQVQGAALPAPNNDNLFALIDQWAKQIDIAPELAQSALYFLHLPARSPLRERLYLRSKAVYVALSIPDSIDELRNKII